MGKKSGRQPIKQRHFLLFLNLKSLNKLCSNMSTCAASCLDSLAAVLICPRRRKRKRGNWRIKTAPDWRWEAAALRDKSKARSRWMGGSLKVKLGEANSTAQHGANECVCECGQWTVFQGGTPTLSFSNVFLFVRLFNPSWSRRSLILTAPWKWFQKDIHYVKKRCHEQPHSNKLNWKLAPQRVKGASLSRRRAFWGQNRHVQYLSHLIMSSLVLGNVAFAQWDHEAESAKVWKGWKHFGWLLFLITLLNFWMIYFGIK